jgi:hypothetical protein
MLSIDHEAQGRTDLAYCALARDDVQVVVRADIRELITVGQVPGQFLGFGGALAQDANLDPIALDRGDLDRRRSLRNADDAGPAERTQGVRETGSMVTGLRRDDPAVSFLHTQAGQLGKRAADLE